MIKNKKKQKERKNREKTTEKKKWKNEEVKTTFITKTEWYIFKMQHIHT